MRPKSTPVPCSVDDCVRQARSLGWCSTHLSRWYEHGTTELPSPLDRLLSRLDRTSSPHGCWLWIGPVLKGGYGHFYMLRRQVMAHRAAWTLLRGPIPDGLCVLHNCPGGDNPRCANPDHLWIGTNLDNIRDRTDKGRSAMGDANASRKYPEKRNRGADNWATKLTDQTVLAIRSRYGHDGQSLAVLATEYGVTKQAIAAIIKRKTWRHVT